MSKKEKTVPITEAELKAEQEHEADAAKAEEPDAFEEIEEIEKALEPPGDPALVKHGPCEWVQFLNSSTKLQSNMVGVGAYVSNPSGQIWYASYHGHFGIVIEGAEFAYDIFVPIEAVSVTGRRKP